MRRIIVLASLVFSCIGLCTQTQGYAEDVEHDTCTCKHVQVGAMSTLRGGLCVRTESGSCLMEWGAGGKNKVAIGNGYSQQEAMGKARDQILSTKKVALEIPRYAPAPENADPLQIATGNLSRVPPADYAKAGMLESFVLAASTALARFNDLRFGPMAENLLTAQRNRLLQVVQKGGKLEFEQFVISGSEGCLVVDYQRKIQVFVVTPYANARRC